MKTLFVKQSCLILLASFVLASSAHTSDSDRHGFVGGFGIGHCPYANWDLEDIPGEPPLNFSLDTASAAQISWYGNFQVPQQHLKS